MSRYPISLGRARTLTGADPGRHAVVVGAASPQEGTTSNRYAILGRIATGGMAEIFLARATSLAGVERYVVLKRILPERTRDPVFVRMFLDEARLAAQLQHPNIAQVHDIGRLGDSYFFTMEYVHGEDLRAILQRLAALRRLPPIQHALLIASGAAAALHHAHERAAPDRRPLGIVHRDVSPSNVMVSFEGAVKLVDFGVAKASQRQAETRTGTVKGKIAYLSPEQCKGGAIDRRSDIFSLGIVVYELLTCSRLWKRETDFATMTAIVNEDAPPPSRVRPEITPELDQVVLTALARDPEQRFASAGLMLEALEAAAEHAGKTMSAHALGRFLRELFGERPEPWMELGVSDDAPSIVTVTSQSVIDADALAGAPSLGRPTAIAASAHGEDVENELRRTTQLRRSANPGDDSGSGTSMPEVAPLAMTWSGPVPAISPQRTIRSSSAPPPLAAPPPPPSAPRGSAGSIPPPYGQPPRSPSIPPPFDTQTTASIPPGFAPPSSASMPTTYPSYSGLSATRAEPVPAAKNRRSLGVVIGVAAIAIGIAIGGYLSMRRSPARTPAAAVKPVAPALAAVTIDAAAVTEPAEVAVPVVDAAGTEDAKIIDVDPGPVIVDPVADALAAISRDAGTGSWAGVWKSCGAIKRKDLTLDARAACAQAACVHKKRSDAVALARGLPRARRAAIAKVCSARGVDLDPPRKDPCEIDPMLCQH
jgi:serine/threonine protein kinase